MRKSTLEDKDIIKIIQLLQQKYVAESKSKCVKSFIQFFSVNSFTVALWTEKDIELYQPMSDTKSVVVDATGSIVSKLGDKEIYYFAFISYNRSLKTEPIPRIELFADLSKTHTLKFMRMRFL